MTEERVISWLRFWGQCDKGCQPCNLTSCKIFKALERPEQWVKRQGKGKK